LAPPCYTLYCFFTQVVGATEFDRVSNARGTSDSKPRTLASAAIILIWLPTDSLNQLSSSAIAVPMSFKRPGDKQAMDKHCTSVLAFEKTESQGFFLTDGTWVNKTIMKDWPIQGDKHKKVPTGLAAEKKKIATELIQRLTDMHRWTGRQVIIA